MERKVKESIQGVEIPTGTPSNRSFVPKKLRSQMIDSANTSLISYHPDVCTTIFCIMNVFGGQTCGRTLQSTVYGSLFSLCSKKTSSRPPVDLVWLLPVPKHPWSNISLELDVGLPTFEGNTVVLMAVDQFYLFIYLSIFNKGQMYPSL